MNRCVGTYDIPHTAFKRNTEAISSRVSNPCLVDRRDEVAGRPP